MAENSEAGVGATVVSVNVSEKTGMKKHDVGSCLAVVGQGLEGDAHAGDWHRQISLLAVESIDRMRLAGLDVWPGDFAENITTKGIELVTLPVGTRLRVGGNVILEVTQIGKECPRPCAIYYQAGECVMPKEGIFVTVIEGGDISVGDAIEAA